MPTTNDIASAWSEALESSTTLAAFCVGRFGQEHTVRQGFRKGRELGEDDAPFLVVVPFLDEGGDEVATTTHKVVMTIGLVDGVVESFGQRGERARGFESMSLMEQAVRDVLEKADYVLSRWTGEYECPGPDFYIRHILFEIDIPRTIGGEY
jgi:hypothetical protein